ncbi:MAG TPA: hypothetical protein VEJ18_09910, partial [Planctomycetota bacterium]|nr:hypothetical protein [Planctomycetota bacterium]
AASPSGKTPRADALFEEIDRRWGGKIRVYCDLLTQDLGTWLRIPMDEIAYRFLPGSIRMGGPWGFQHLVNDLRERVPGALTGMTLKLLDVADIKALVFPQVEEFTRYTAGSALTRVLWPTADSSSPSPEPPAPPTDGGSSSASSGPAPSSTS